MSTTNSPSSTSPGRGASLALDEVVSALRGRGAELSVLPLGKVGGDRAARSAEVIARFLALAGGACCLVEVGSSGEAETQVFGVVATLPGSPFILAFGGGAFKTASPDGAPSPVVAAVAAARELGGRALIYAIDAPDVAPPEADIEALSLRESVMPFVREALRSHAEACVNGWTEDDERLLLPAYASVDGDARIGADEAIERATARSRRAFVLGDFGSGRSTQLARYAASRAAAYLADPEGRPCPLLLPLRRMRPDLGVLLREHVPGLSPEAFFLAAEIGMVVSIFDGFDELEIRGGPGELAAAIQSLTGFVDRGKASAVLAMSRTAAEGLASPPAPREEGDEGPSVSVVTLHGLEREEAIRLVREGLGSEEEASRRVRALEEEVDFEELARRPALLALVALNRPWLTVQGSAASEASERASIYTAAVRDWLRASLPRAEGEPQEDVIARGLITLRALARSLFEAGEEETTESAIEGAIPGEDGRRAGEILGAAVVVARPRSPEDGDRRVRFVHRSLLDYFVALDVAASLDEGKSGALDRPRLPPSVIGLLAEMDGWERRRKRLRDILQKPYQQRSSENALLAIYMASSAKCGGEALGRVLSEDIPSGVKLAGARLAGVSLPWASLPEADLDGAELSLADLSNADMRGARLDRSRADHASFDGADLEWATFVGADLFGASFVDANLAGVSLREANIEGAIRVGARGAGGALISPGIEAPADAPLGSAIDSSPRMGQALAFSADGRWAAIGRGFTMVILDAVTGHARRILRGPASVALAAAFSPDGSLLVSAAKGGSIQVWDLRRGRVLRELQVEPATAAALAFTPDSETFASASDSGPVRVWDARRGDVIRLLDGKVSWFYSLAFSPTGDLLAAALADGSIRVWDARRGDVVSTINTAVGRSMALAFSADGAAVASTGVGESVRVWDARRGTLISILEGRAAATARSAEREQARASGARGAAPFTAVACSADGSWIAASSSELGICVWDARRGALINVIKGSEGARSLAFVPLRSALQFALTDGTICAAEARSGRVLRAHRGHAIAVDCASISPAGDTIASASAGGSIRIWDARRGDLLHTLVGPAATGASVVFSFDSDTLAVVLADGSVQMWCARRGELLRTLRDPDHDVAALAFSPDGEALASGAVDGGVCVWDARGGGLVRRLKGGASRVASLAFSPAGDVLAAADVEGMIRLWDPRSGDSLGELAGHGDVVSSIAFSPYGEQIASASSDGTVRIWDARDRIATHVVERCAEHAQFVAFSPDGDRLASAHSDSLVRLWDVSRGEVTLKLEGHTAGVSSVAFSADGETLVTASADGTTRLFRASDGRCLCVMLATDIGWVTLAGDAPFFIGGGDVSALLRFTAGSTSMPASLWDPVFRRPDLVAQSLWGEPKSAEEFGLKTVADCEAELLLARESLGLTMSRRDGPTAAIAVQRRAGPHSVRPRTGESERAPTERPPPMPRALSWIHLADLHFGVAGASAPHRFDQAAVMSAILRDVAESGQKPPDFIFVTGDVAWSGQPSEYEEAARWLRALAEAAGVSMDQVRVVPGNHDVDRGRANTKPVARAHSEIRAAPEELDHELNDASLRLPLADKLSAFAEFVRATFPGHPRAGDNGLDWHERLPATPGKRGRARIAGLSTVWISDGSDGRLHKGQAVPFIRNMILGERQIEQALGDIEEDELLVVLTHHPPEWLHRDSADELAKALSRRTYVHLCSHLHDAPQVPILRRFGAFGASVRGVAGSAHGDLLESKKHGYTWGAVRWNSADLSWQAGLSPRIYDEERAQMRPDGARYKLDAEGFVWEPLRLRWPSEAPIEVQR